MSQEPLTNPDRTPETTGDPDPEASVAVDVPLDYASGSSSVSTHDTSDSTKDVAKDQAAQVGQGAADAGKHVAGVARDQAGNVAGEAKAQARNLAEQARSEVQGQAHTQKQRAAEGLRSIGQELGSMAEKSEQPGTATDLARRASQAAHDAADWLEQRDPGDLLDEIRSFARRRPGAFVGIAAAAGVVAGRLTRGMTASDDTSNVADSSNSGGSSSSDTFGESTASPSSSWTGEADTSGVSYSAPAYETTAAGATYSTGTEAYTEFPLDGDAIGRGDPMSSGAGYTSGSYDADQSAGQQDDRSIGDLFSNVTQDLTLLLRQEVELAKAEAKQSVTRAGRGAGMLGGAGYAGHLTVLFLSVAAWWAIGDGIGRGWSALIVAAFWAIVAAILAVMGRAQLKAVQGLQRTTETVKEIPDAVKGNEEAVR